MMEDRSMKPEDPLVTGLANNLVEMGIPIFGPSSAAAVLEGSKDFMKKLCDKYVIPTAKYRTFIDPSEAKQYVTEHGAHIVIKTDGLAAGKEVIVAMALEEAFEAVDFLLVKDLFGSGGSLVIMRDLEIQNARLLRAFENYYSQRDRICN